MIRYASRLELLAGFRAALFDELIDHFLKVWITGAEAAREPISATLGNSFAVRYHIELASLARYTDSFNV
jgi:hypothetical protein